MTTTIAEPRTSPAPGTDALDVSVLVHVTDAEARVGVLVQAYAHVFVECGRRGELVFILDGVAGRVLEELERLQARRSDVRVLTLQGGGHGESIAFKAALEHSRGRYLLTTWDYLQVDPRELGALLRTIEETDGDLVSSWRWPRVDPLLNRVQSTLFNWVLRQLSRVPLHDLNCNFRLMRREVLEEIAVYGDLFRFLPIMASRRGFRVSEIKVRHLEEKGTIGFFGIGVYLRRALDILAVTFLTRFTRKPLRFFGIIGFLLVFLGLFLALPPFLAKVIWDASIQDRPIVLVGVILISFGLQFIGFGLVGEIIIFTQSRNLKDYKIERIVESRLPIPASPPAAAKPAIVPAIAPVVASPAPPAEEPAELTVRRPAPGEDVLLDTFVREHSGGTPFHLSEWRRVVEDVCDRPAEVLVAEAGGSIVGFLPWFHVKSVFLGRVGISMPFAVYGGCLATRPETAQMLIREAARLSDEAGNSYLELRHTTAWEGGDLRLAATDRYVTFIRDLPPDPAACLDIIPRKARAEARRGRDLGLQFVERCDLKLFHRLFAVNKQRLGSPAMPMSMLRSIVARFGDSVVMHQVLHTDGTCIAAVVSFRYQDRILPYYSGAVPGCEDIGANNFMYWKLMEWAAANGLRSFDFGRSRKDSGPARFKKNMGFEAIPLCYQFHLGEGGKVPEFTPDNPKLGIYQRVWRAIPLPIARLAGSQIFRQLP